MTLDNDTRGWIMSCVSGAACVLGSSIICVDLIARNCFGKRDFRITNSDVFLSSSLSLSAGVLIFISLYSMLPTSKDYLIRAGYSSESAAYLLITLFVFGVVVINGFSILLHRYIPSHVVSCAHTHEDAGKHEDVERVNTSHTTDHTPSAQPFGSGVTETSPLLPQNAGKLPSSSPSPRNGAEHSPPPCVLSSPADAGGSLPKSNLTTRLSEHLRKLVGGSKPTCDKNGPCFGVSQACGLECAKIRVSQESDTVTKSDTNIIAPDRTIPSHPETVDGEYGHASSSDSNVGQIESPSAQTAELPLSGSTTVYTPPNAQPPTKEHHHHVPQNAFLSIGLQTSIAIALHKVPEGFITYATNHTNPTLGWSVFVALFIHNITEGFAMSLPLYLALKSKMKAIVWSSLLGGISQPAGAGIAALWIWCSKKAHEHSPGDSHGVDGPSWAVYGCMFAATAGVMTNVALQLFSESLMLSHRSSLCIGFAILGMGILGLSFALTA